MATWYRARRHRRPSGRENGPGAAYTTSSAVQTHKSRTASTTDRRGGPTAVAVLERDPRIGVVRLKSATNRALSTPPISAAFPLGISTSPRACCDEGAEAGGASRGECRYGSRARLTARCCFAGHDVSTPGWRFAPTQLDLDPAPNPACVPAGTVARLFRPRTRVQGRPGLRGEASGHRLLVKGVGECDEFRKSGWATAARLAHIFKRPFHHLSSHACRARTITCGSAGRRIGPHRAPRTRRRMTPKRTGPWKETPWLAARFRPI